MSTKRRTGAGTWILGFLTLIAIFNVFNAVILLNLEGRAYTANFDFFGVALGSLNVELYLWISLIITFVLFGATSFSIYRGLPADPRVLQRLTKVEENLTLNSAMLENTQVGFFRKLEENEKTNDEIFRKINLSLEDMRKETSDSLDKQKKALQDMEKESRQNTEAIKKQAKGLTDLKKKIEKIGKEPQPKPKLTGKTTLQKFKSVPHGLATKLKGMKITNVGEFLATDSGSMAENTSELAETIAHMQSEAQLLMIPDIYEQHAKLLVKVGITSQRELANQDLIQLYRAIVGVAQSSVEKGELSKRKIPTIEDVSTWIKNARL